MSTLSGSVGSPVGNPSSLSSLGADHVHGPGRERCGRSRKRAPPRRAYMYSAHNPIDQECRCFGKSASGYSPKIPPCWAWRSPG